eukprot:SAG31_NODE_8807_length_1384_cov_1.055253_3_plen_121_part_01
MEALTCIGGFRMGAEDVFPRVDGVSVISKFAHLAAGDINAVLKPNDTEMLQRYVARGHDIKNLATYESLSDFVRIAEEWQQGSGREEQWIKTLKQYFPLHTDSELIYLKNQWGNPKLVFQF